LEKFAADDYIVREPVRWLGPDCGLDLPSGGELTEANAFEAAHTAEVFPSDAVEDVSAGPTGGGIARLMENLADDAEGVKFLREAGDSLALARVDAVGVIHQVN
jgi:hypothetical protein